MNLSLRDAIVDGFAVIEQRDVKVVSIKLNRAQLNKLRADKTTDLGGDDLNIERLWGARLLVNNELKNPVIVGEDDSKAILVKNKWVLKNISQYEKNMNLRNKKEEKETFKKLREAGRKYAKFIKIKKQFQEQLKIAPCINEKLKSLINEFLSYVFKENNVPSA
jgi:hypothetical protein